MSFYEVKKQENLLSESQKPLILLGFSKSSVSPLAPVESLDAQYACGAFFFAYASVLAPKRHLFCLRQTPGRARSRYALQVFSFAGCTSRVLAGVFFIPGRHFSGCGRKIKAARGTLWLFHFIFEKEIMEK